MRSGLRGAGSLALAGLIANSANVVVTFVLSHFLSSRGYGAFNQLVYLFLVLSMPGYAVIVAVVRQVTRWESHAQHDLVGPWIMRCRVAAVAVTGVVLVGSILAGHFVATGLSLPNASGIAPVLTAGAAWLLLSIDRGLLQSRRLYGPMARNLVIEGLVRTSGTLVLVAAGLGVRGAMLGILASAICADVDARLSLRAHPTTQRSISALPSPAQQPAAMVASLGDDDVEEIAIATSGEAPVVEVGRVRALPDFLAALLALALLASLAGLDVIVLGRLGPHGSGAYAAIAVTSKLLFFAALVLSGYLLPEATTRWHRGEHAYRQLAVTIAFLAAATLLGEAMALVGGRRIMGLVFPHRLLVDVRFQAELIGAMALLAVSVVLTYYLLGIGRRGVVAVLAAGTVLLAVLLVLAGGHPGPTVHADLIAQACLLGVLCVYLSLSGKPVASVASAARVSEPALTTT